MMSCWIYHCATTAALRIEVQRNASIGKSSVCAEKKNFPIDCNLKCFSLLFLFQFKAKFMVMTFCMEIYCSILKHFSYYWKTDADASTENSISQDMESKLKMNFEEFFFHNMASFKTEGKNLTRLFPRYSFSCLYL